MNWLARYQRLKGLGILGMNARNAVCILELNPRAGCARVDSKLKMHDLCRMIDVVTPEIFAVVAAPSALCDVPRLLDERTEFVVKPNCGAGGRGVLVIKGQDGDRYVRTNGEPVSVDDLREHIADILSGMFSLGGRPDEAIIQQRVVASPAFERISWRGIPDIRLLVYKHEPAMAMLRLPTRQSGGRANLHQGGIGAGVDLKSGIVMRAVLSDRVTEHHPDTGERIVGFAVPHWAQLLEIAGRVSRVVGLGYLGVDLAIDRDLGPVLLEANARPGLSIQIANGTGLLPRFAAIEP